MERLLTLLAVLVLSSCISSSQRFDSAPVRTQDRGTVLLPSDPDYADLTPELGAMLKRNGFQPVTNGQARYSVTVYVGGGGFMSARMVFSEGGVAKFSTSSLNPGFGTWLAHQAVRRSLFRSAMEKLEEQLRTLP